MAKEARDVIEQIVREFGLEDHKFPPFDSLAELKIAITHSGLEYEVTENADYSDDLAIALACLEVFHSYVSNCALASYVRIMVRKNGNPKTKASFTLFSGISSDVGAVILLCRAGYDIQAKNVLRSLREKVDYLIAVQLDRSFAVGYVEAANSDSNNAFWHSRVARGKLKKHISKRLNRFARHDRILWDEGWSKKRDTLERWLGEAVHPSHTTGLLSAFPGIGSEKEVGDLPGWFGNPSDLSIPTIRAAMSIAVEVIYLVKLRHLATSEDFSSIGDYNDSDLDLFVYHVATENFLQNCVGNSIFNPNLNLLKLLSYFDGYMIEPIDGKIDVKEYEAEMLEILIGLLEKARNRISEMIGEVESIEKS